VSAVWVLCEARGGVFRPATYELLALARGLAAAEGAKAVALVAGADTATADGLDGLAHKVVRLTATGLDPFTADAWVEALSGAIGALGAGVGDEGDGGQRRDGEGAAGDGAPRAVLFGESGRTRELLPRLAARLDAWALSNCVDLRADGGGGWELRRPVYGGKAYVTDAVPAAGLLLAAFRPHSFDAQAVAGGLATTFVEVAEPVSSPRVEVLERTEGTARRADLTEAVVVVAGGRGMKGPDNFGLLEDLADALEGAVGYSRALVDAGHAEHALQVGKSGKTVSPTLYIAAGVSGAIHHIMGMDTSKVVVAINSDPNAPIFGYADYGIVGDALQVMPALTERIRAVTD
jgi:electron transfer flavoprotein alpha subunit